MRTVLKFIILAVIISFTGCISWDEGWKTKVQASGTGDVKALLAAAASLETTADTADKVKNVITAYEKIIAIDPGNYNALAKAGEFAMLNGYIYAKDKKEKEEYYLKSINYCERAMYTNPEFKNLLTRVNRHGIVLVHLLKTRCQPCFTGMLQQGNTGLNALIP